ncbi:ribonuclease H-like domain-containing protein [Tanacetum coccineum]
MIAAELSQYILIGFFIEGITPRSPTNFLIQTASIAASETQPCTQDCVAHALHLVVAFALPVYCSSVDAKGHRTLSALRKRNIWPCAHAASLDRSPSRSTRRKRLLVVNPIGLFLSQKKYASEILERSHMVNYNPSRNPLTLSRSSAEAEYRGVANAVAETCWIRNLLRGLHSLLSSATLVRVLHVLSHYQFADIFTKGLPFALFEEFQSSLSIWCALAPTAGEC